MKNSWLPLPAHRFTPWIVFVLVLSARIPFLSTVSLGVDRDAWSTGVVAEKIAHTFAYEASRLPGYPFIEIVTAVFAGSPLWVYNLLTAIMSALCAVFFYLLLRQLNARLPLWLTFAFAFSVIVFIESLELMDYMWALAFVIGAFYFAVKRKYGWSGFFLGLAVACRITSGAMLLPLAILSYEDLKMYKRTILVFAAGFIIPVVLFFLPVIYTYGFSFFNYYGDNSQLSFRLVARSLTVKLWGYPGFIGLLIGAGYGFMHRKKIQIHDKKLLIACITVILIYTAAFLKLPHEIAYLLPIVPFVLILAEQLVPSKKVVMLACTLIGISSLVDITPNGIFHPVIDEKITKEYAVEQSKNVMQKFRKLSGSQNFILVARHYRPMFRYLFKEMNEFNTYHTVSCKELAGFQQKGIQIFVLDTAFIEDCGINVINLSLPHDNVYPYH